MLASSSVVNRIDSSSWGRPNSSTSVGWGRTKCCLVGHHRAEDLDADASRLQRCERQQLVAVLASPSVHDVARSGAELS